MSTKQLRGKLSKLRNDVLGAGTMDGSPEPESMDTGYDMTGACDDTRVVSDVETRDLSAWRVSIPRLETRNDSSSGRAYFVFIVQVKD